MAELAAVAVSLPLLIGISETKRAAKEAAHIVMSLTRFGPTATTLLSSPGAWHDAVALSFAEAYCLLWQNDAEGGTVKDSDDQRARLVAAHLIDLLLTGRIQLYWAEAKKKLKGLRRVGVEELCIKVVSTEPVGVSPTDKVMLPRLDELFTKMKEKGKHLLLYEYIEKHICDYMHLWKDRLELEKETFASLVDRGILTKEKKKMFLVTKQTVYPTVDGTPESILVQDMRRVYELDQTTPTVFLETFMKLVSCVTKIYSKEELAEDDGLRDRVKAIKKNLNATFLNNDGTAAGFQQGDAEAALDYSKSANSPFSTVDES